MLPPIRPILRDGLRAVAQKRIPEVLAASLSLVIVFASHLAKPAPSVASLEPRVASAERAPAANDAGDPTADFLECVALSHVAAAQTRAAKERIAAAAPKDASSPPQPPEAASASAATSAAPDRPGPFQYGLRLFASVGDFVSASDKRVIDGVASIGDAVASFDKKLKS